MKKIFVTLLGCVFLTICTKIYGQTIPGKKAELYTNSHLLTSVSLTAPVNRWGLESEICYVTPRMRWILSLGVEYANNDIGGRFDKWVSRLRGGGQLNIANTIGLPIKIGFARALGLKNNHLIEFNAIYTHRWFEQQVPNVVSINNGRTDIIEFYLGYRFQKPNGGLFVRAGVNTIFQGNTKADRLINYLFGIPIVINNYVVDYNLFRDGFNQDKIATPFAPFVSVGWSFRVKKAKVEDIE